MTLPAAEARELLIGAISRASVSGQEAEVADYLRNWMSAHGFAAHIDAAGNAVGERGGGPLTVVLLGHIDTVPGEIPVRIDEHEVLHGRGSADMKGGLAAAIIAAETLKAHGDRLSGGVRLLVPCDEEGMMTGIKRMVADGQHLRSDGSPADGAIVCEPEELELCLFQRGGIRLRVTFTGVQAHGAMPYAGRNPIPALARFILELLTMQETLQARLGEHAMLGHAWITSTVLEAGSWPQLNVMHAAARVGVDIRTVPGVTHKEIYNDLHAILERLAAEEGVQAQLEVIDDRPWTQTAPDAGIVRSLEAACEVVLGRPALYGGVPGTTDGTFLHKAGVPIVTVGPGDREIPHQVGEFVRVDELVSSARLYVAAGALFLTT